jgi:hypothetical protein
MVRMVVLIAATVMIGTSVQGAGSLIGQDATLRPTVESPMEATEPFPSQLRWRFLLRILAPSGQITQIRIDQGWDETLLAEERIYGATLKGRNDGASSSFVRRTRNSADCQQLIRVVKKLQRGTLPLLPSADLVLDTPSYELSVETRVARMQATFDGASEQRMSWLRDLRQLFDESVCR